MIKPLRAPQWSTALLVLCASLHWSAPVRAGTLPSFTLLNTTFEGQSLGPIGTGGPGQPVSVSSVITATVVEQTFPVLRGMNRALEIGHDASSSAGFAVFEFPGDAEPGDGNVVVEAAIFQPFGARFLLYVRENGGAAANWGSLTIADDGTLGWSDASTASASLGTYNDGETLDLALNFDLDARTVEIFVDGVLVRPASPTYGGPLGIGSILLGIDRSTIAPTHVDNLRVTYYPPIELFGDGFETPTP